MGMKMNTAKTRKKIARTIDEFPDFIERATKSHVDEVFKETQARVPVETGALLATGRIVKNSSSKNHFSFSIWYGEPGNKGIDYAAAVHEILKHAHGSPRQAKYVEQPLLESIPAAKKTLSAAAKAGKEATFR